MMDRYCPKCQNYYGIVTKTENDDEYLRCTGSWHIWIEPTPEKWAKLWLQ